MARAGDRRRLGVDCPDGGKKVARQQARLPLVLGVPAFFTHDGKHTPEAAAAF